jgi:transglutaminase-like putative cysteine protease
MKLAVVHHTLYTYQVAPRRVSQSLRLWPKEQGGQRRLQWRVRCGEQDLSAARPGRDAWGNESLHCLVERPARQLLVAASGIVETADSAVWVDDDSTGRAPELLLRATPLTEIAPTQWDDLARRLPLARLRRAGQADQDLPAVADWLALADAVRLALPWRDGVTQSDTSAGQALALGAGVCQDHAHVYVALCRSLGWPARYVSGYWLAGEGAAPRAGEPALASHAWAEVCVDVPARRWLAIDISHACLAAGRHVRLATGPDYSACAPVRGVRHGGTGEQLAVDVRLAVLPAAADRTATTDQPALVLAP